MDIYIPTDKVRDTKLKSRAAFGRAGIGRKTFHRDKRREANRRACRRNEPPSDSY